LEPVNRILYQPGFEPPKGLEKGFFQVVGVTGTSISERRQRGKAPMEICFANFGSRPKAGFRPLAFENAVFSSLLQIICAEHPKFQTDFS
jgi:hypothetical protein